MMKEIEGFIIKGTAYDLNNHLQIKLFGRTADAEPFQIILDNSDQYFFTTANRPTEFKTINGLYAEKIVVKSFKDKKEIKEKLDKNNLMTYEFDVRPVERLLMDLNIYGAVKIKYQDELNQNEFILKNPIIEPVQLNPSQHLFSCLSFDIETAKDGRVLSIAIHFLEAVNNKKGEGVTEVKKVFILSNENLESSEMEIISCATEINLLKSFMQTFVDLDPDLVIGWNVIGFDFKYIYDRCEKLKIKFNFSRDQFDSRMFQTARGEWTIDIPGRVVIDGPWALKMNFFSYESFKLNEVAKVVLGEIKDIDEDEVFDKWAEIERRFREDKLALIRYNLKDAVLVTKIFLKTNLIDLLINRSLISGMLLDKVGGSTAAYDHFFLPRFHEYGYIAPNVIDVEWDKEAKGGFVLNPKIGVHDHVVVLDFKSLYPTVMRTFFIDPLSRVDKDIDPLSTPVGIKFSRTHHILPMKIAELLERRAQAKIDKNENLSMAIKILMNSFYGVMGSSGCRFYHHELPDAITGTGQWVLKTTIEFLESQNLQILYGDTDSIFVKLDLKEKEFISIFDEGKVLVTKVNQFLAKKIADEFGLESFLEIQFDKVFKKLILTATRGKEDGAKKRYAGLVVKNKQGVLQEEIILTGMEFVRSDWSRLAKNFQFELVHKIFYQDSNEAIAEYILDVIKKLELGEFDQDLTLKKRLTKPIEEYIKNIPPHVKALTILFQSTGQRKRQAEYVMTERGAMPIELKPKDFDYDYYLEKQIAPIANSLLPLIGLDFEKIRNKQLSLF